MSMRPEGELGEIYDAHQKLLGNARARQVTNFEGQFHLTIGEKDPECVRVRRLLYDAERGFKDNNFSALALYSQAWPMWVDLCLRYPEFAKVNFAQEDIYEAQLHAMRMQMNKEPTQFLAVMTGMAQNTLWPFADWQSVPTLEDKAKEPKYGQWPVKDADGEGRGGEGGGGKRGAVATPA